MTTPDGLHCLFGTYAKLAKNLISPKNIIVNSRICSKQVLLYNPYELEKKKPETNELFVRLTRMHKAFVEYYYQLG